MSELFDPQRSVSSPSSWLLACPQRHFLITPARHCWRWRAWFRWRAWECWRCQTRRQHRCIGGSITIWLLLSIVHERAALLLGILVYDGHTCGKHHVLHGVFTIYILRANAALSIQHTTL